MKESTQTIDDYIAGFPPATQDILQKVRAAIREVAPDATERISYGIPTFWQKENVVHFGGWPSHIGFYPGAEPIEVFADRLTDYKTSKGTVQFPLDKPIPYDLIKEMTEFRLRQIK